MILEFFPEGYGLLFFAFAGVFIVAFVLAHFEIMRIKKRQLQRITNSIHKASPSELLKIYEQIVALEGVEYNVVPRVELLVKEYEAKHKLEKLKKAAQDDNAYREDLLEALSDVTALSQLVFDLDMYECMDQTNKIFDEHLAFVERYLEAIKRTRVKEELHTTAKKGYVSLKKSFEEVERAKKNIFLGLRKAVQEGMPLEEVKKIVAEEKEKAYASA